MAFDYLNRMTTSQGFNYIHDTVGNRLSKRIGNQVKNGYTWDSSNRLRTYTDQNTNQGNVNTMGKGGANYTYLPNGLRCTKVWDAALEPEQLSEGEPILSSFYDNNTLFNDTTTRYRDDGQMTLEEDVTFTQGENTYVDQTSYLLGGRGIEMITARRMDGPTPAGLDLPRSSFPIYDGHGNMIATLAKNGTGFTLANEKKYDVWGAVRSSSGAGSHVVNPNKQYCANLGHTWDGESGLIYMRARYYEPSTGRFITEDPAKQWVNWYSYGNNSPTMMSDATGKVAHLKAILIGALVAAAFNIGGQILIFGNVRTHLVINAALWGGIGAGIARSFAKLAGSQRESILNALFSFDRIEIGTWTRATLAGQAATRPGVAMGTQLSGSGDAREKNGILGKALDGILGNNVTLHTIIEFMGLEDYD